MNSPMPPKRHVNRPWQDCLRSHARLPEGKRKARGPPSSTLEGMQDQGGEFVVQIRFMDRSRGDTLLLHPCLERFKRSEVRDGEDDEEITLVVPAATEFGLCGGKRKGRMNCLSSLQAGWKVGSG